jgi:hypothetical protein
VAPDKIRLRITRYFRFIRVFLGGRGRGKRSS